MKIRSFVNTWDQGPGVLGGWVATGYPPPPWGPSEERFSRVGPMAAGPKPALELHVQGAPACPSLRRAPGCSGLRDLPTGWLMRLHSRSPHGPLCSCCRQDGGGHAARRWRGGAVSSSCVSAGRRLLLACTGSRSERRSTAKRRLLTCPGLQ